jgi:YihY family inner membrane protein
VNLGPTGAVLREFLATTRDQQVGFLAAAVAYYAFVSLVPLLLLVVAVGSAVGGDRFAELVVGAGGQILPPEGKEAVESTLTSGRGRGGATVVGASLLLWSSLKLFRGLDLVFSRVYGETEAKPLLGQLQNAAVVLGAIGVAVTAAVAIGGALPALEIPFAGVVSTVVLVGVLAVVFLPMFYVFPDAELTVREALPGAVATAAGWGLLTGGFQLYVRNAGQFELYGALGAALLLVTWFYLAAIIITLGGVLNAVLASDATAGEGDAAEDEEEAGPPGPAPDVTTLERELDALRERLDERTVSRETFRAEMEAYVRGRLRRGHARGWGPYLVLLYGTAMTLGAFVYLDGGWAVLAMLVVWLSTLGLYVLMVLVGAGLRAVDLPGRVVSRLRNR